MRKTTALLAVLATIGVAPEVAGASSTSASRARAPVRAHAARPVTSPLAPADALIVVAGAAVMTGLGLILHRASRLAQPAHTQLPQPYETVEPLVEVAPQETTPEPQVTALFGRL